MRAEVAHLRKGINESVGLMKSLQKSSMTTANVLKSAFAAGATMFAFHQIQNGIRNTVTAFGETATMIENTKHLSEVLGSTTEEIQVLQRAASFAEVDVDMLNRNIKIMTKNLGAASMGLGTAGDGLSALGIDVQTLIRLPLLQQIEMISGGMNKLGTSAQKAAIAQQIFGRGGMEMIPFLAAGGEALTELQSEMEITGELFSNFEAAAVDEMGDSMGKLRGIFQAFKNQLVIQLAPAVQYITELMQNFAKSFGGARPLMTRAIEYAVNGMAKLVDGAQMLYGMWFKIKGVVLSVAAGVSKTFGVLGSIIGGIITGDLTQLKNVFGMIASGFKLGLLEAINALAKGLDFVLSKLGMDTGVSKFTEGMINETKFQMSLLGSMIGQGAFGQEFTNSLSKSAGDAFSKAAELSGGTGWGETFKSKWAEMMGGGVGGGVDIEKAIIEETMDILPPLEKEKALREQIADTMKDTADFAKEIKDFGEGTSYRTGEYSPRVGGVSGGVTGMMGTDAAGVSAAAVAATSQSNTRTGADQNTTLLQGILEATRMTASNTMRAPVAVMG
jgi:hypothetical protein